MRKKNAGALFMDFEISPDDRIGGATPRSRCRATPPPKNKPKRPTQEHTEETGCAQFINLKYDYHTHRYSGRDPAPNHNNHYSSNI